jgi:hypothetical protein
MTGLNTPAVITAAIDHLETAGLFESVQDHERTSASTGGLTADVWVADIKPLPAQSGLNVTSALLTLTVRIYLNAMPPADNRLEQTITGAADVLLTAYNAAFTFDGTVNWIDLLGEYGTPLSAIGGYVNVGGVFCRCMTITVPCVIDDVWAQSPS